MYIYIYTYMGTIHMGDLRLDRKAKKNEILSVL